MNPADPRLDLLQRYAQGAASAEDVIALETQITHDAEFCRFVVEYLHVDASLEEHAVEPVPANSQHRPHYAVWLIAAAMLVLVSVFAWWMSPARAGVSVVVIESSDPGWKPGTQTRLQALSLAGGSLKLRISASGVLLDAGGPVEMRLLDPMHVRVLRGKLTADVGEHGKGFVLDTPQTQVVDLGTRFGVDAATDGHTDVVVFQGAVELFDRQQQPLDAKPVRRLEQGEAVRVNATRQMARIVNVTGGLQPGEWSTQQPPVDCTIAEVSDNFGRDEEWFFYRIVPHGMAPGVAAFANRPHTWEPADGREFSASLANADLVQTFRGAGKRRLFELRVTLARPATLFVLMPKLGVPVAWLAENFTRTGEELMIHESDARPWVHLPFEVWKLDVRVPGTVTLGPANHDEKGNPTFMYGIAAKPL